MLMMEALGYLLETTREEGLFFFYFFFYQDSGYREGVEDWRCPICCLLMIVLLSLFLVRLQKLDSSI